MYCTYLPRHEFPNLIRLTRPFPGAASDSTEAHVIPDLSRHDIGHLYDPNTPVSLPFTY